MRWQCESRDIDTDKQCESPARYKITKASPYATPMYRCEECAQYYLRLRSVYNIDELKDNPRLRYKRGAHSGIIHYGSGSALPKCHNCGREADYLIGGRCRNCIRHEVRASREWGKTMTDYRDNPYKFGRNRLRYRMAGVMDNPRFQRIGSDEYNVSLSANEVREFKSRWPASGLPERSVTFRFDQKGDLVDMFPTNWGESADGAAVSALAEDAKRYARSKWHKNPHSSPSGNPIDWVLALTYGDILIQEDTGEKWEVIRKERGWRVLENKKSGEELSMENRDLATHMTGPNTFKLITKSSMVPKVTTIEEIPEWLRSKNPRHCESCGVGSVHKEGLCIQCYYGRSDNPSRLTKKQMEGATAFLKAMHGPRPIRIGGENWVIEKRQRDGRYTIKRFGSNYVMGTASSRDEAIDEIKKYQSEVESGGYQPIEGDDPDSIPRRSYTEDNPRISNQRRTGPSLTKEYESEALRAEYHHVRLTEPKGYLRYRWIDLSVKKGIKGLVAVRPAGKVGKRGGRTEFQKLGFRKELWTVSEVDAWLRKHGYGRLKKQ